MKAIDRLYQAVGDIENNDILKEALMGIAELLEKEVEHDAERRKMLAVDAMSAYIAFVTNDSRRKSDAFRTEWARHLLKNEHWNGSYSQARQFIDSLDLYI